MHPKLTYTERTSIINTKAKPPSSYPHLLYSREAFVPNFGVMFSLPLIKFGLVQHILVLLLNTKLTCLLPCLAFESVR